MQVYLIYKAESA